MCVVWYDGMYECVCILLCVVVKVVYLSVHVVSCGGGGVCVCVVWHGGVYECVCMLWWRWYECVCLYVVVEVVCVNVYVCILWWR